MSRIVKQFHKSLQILERRRNKGWDKIYVAVDLHETTLEPTWSDERSSVFYNDSIEALKLLSDNNDICLILWTSSSKENAREYKEMLAAHGVNMQYINENPEVADKHYADYESKFYVNVILDDKAGFLPDIDWPAIKSYFQMLKNIQSEVDVNNSKNKIVNLVNNID
jgi:hypothetical protein